MAGVKIVDLPALGRDLINTDLLEVSLNGGGSRKITGQEIMNASKLAIGSTPIVSGTVGRLLFQGTGDVLQQSGNLFWDNPNLRLGIGISTPLYTLDVAGNIHGNSIFAEYNIVSTAGNVWLSDGYAIGDYGTGNNRIEFYNNRMSFFGNGNEALRIVGSTQNVLIGTTIDSGQKLNVNGSAIIKGGLSVNVSTPQITTVNAASGNKAWSWIMSGNDLQIREDGIGFPMVFKPAGNIITNQNGGNFLIGTTADNGFRLDVNGTARVQSTLGVNGSVTANTASSGTGYEGYKIQDGANARFVAERLITNFLGIGHNSVSGRWDDVLLGSAQRLYFYTGASERMRIFSTGNIGINTTTDAGFRLDVNGTARVSGNLYIGPSPNGTYMYSNGYDLTMTTRSSDRAIWLKQGNSNLVMMLMADGNAGVNNNNALTVWTTANTSANTVASFCVNGISGNTLIGTSTDIASSILTVNSTTKGFLPPRMTNAQRAAIASPAVGLIVYCTDATEGLYVYKSTGWTFMV